MCDSTERSKTCEAFGDPSRRPSYFRRSVDRVSTFDKCRERSKVSFSLTYGKHWQFGTLFDPSVMLLTAAVAFDVIPKPEITATWTSGNLGYATSLYGNLGTFVIATTITY